MPLEDIPSPPVPDQMLLSPENILFGRPVPPIERLRIMSANEWEIFVLEWAHGLGDRYARVQRVGGGRDEGRDVIGYHASEELRWDNYQCKHYDHPLEPAEVLAELAKLAYHTHAGHYTVPECYYFAAPQAVGTGGVKLLESPAEIPSALIDGWKERFAKKVSGHHPPPLSKELEQHIRAFPFSIVDALSPLDLIEAHRKTPYHVYRFGGGLPDRGTPPTVPDQVQPDETRYVQQLMAAYVDHFGERFAEGAGLPTTYAGHFGRSREDFYWAEQLRTFSRDTLPPGTFEALQDEVEAGIIDTVEATHPDGFSRVRAVVAAARQLALAAHPLNLRVRVKDRSGICHQLANDDRVHWCGTE